ncbi:PH domain-containing protein [Corynebacterium sp. MNWGS58]|uniref:PH domain-containing protein n=1 Tax=Corynebacterium sp. 102791.4 TaxID=3104612 RepID=UPI003518D5A5
MSSQPHHAQERKQLDEKKLAAYTALDPFSVTSDKPWELTIRSRRLRVYALVLIPIIMAVHIFMAWQLSLEFTGAAITGIDYLAFPGVGLVISVLVWLALSRPRVRVNSDGVEVRNIIGTRFYYWELIYGLTFPEGARMARLELPEFEYMPLWAIQASDGKDGIEAVRKFRALEAQYMPEE